MDKLLAFLKGVLIKTIIMMNILELVVNIFFKIYQHINLNE
jgi:hypothetical protein